MLEYRKVFRQHPESGLVDGFLALRSRAYRKIRKLSVKARGFILQTFYFVPRGRCVICKVVKSLVSQAVKCEKSAGERYFFKFCRLIG